MSWSTAATLHPVPPYDFAKTLAFLAEFPATQHEQVIGDKRLMKALRIDGVTGLVMLTARGTPDDPTLAYELHANTPLDDAHARRFEDRVRFFLSLDEDIRPFYDLAQRDQPFLARVLPALHGYRQVKFPSVFELAAWSILAQRQSTTQARRMKEKLIARYSTPVAWRDRTFTAFPAAADFQPLDQGAIADCIGNARRAAYLADVIDHFVRVDDTFFHTAPTEEIAAWLRSIKGMGPWSAMFVLLRGLGRMETALLDDPTSTLNQRMMTAARPVYGDITLDALRDIAASYGAWQGYWAHFLRAYGVIAKEGKESH